MVTLDPFDTEKFRISQDFDLGPPQTITLEVPKQILDDIDAYAAAHFPYESREQVLILSAIEYVKGRREYEASPEGKQDAADDYHDFCEACDNED